MNNKLLKAIFSLDSYNRGYKEGIILQPGATVVGTQIGNATIVQQSDFLSNTEGVNKGFYAIAYKDNTTNKVTIAYRGTDEGISPVTDDAKFGYRVGLGNAECAQAQLALEFFDAVAAQVGASNITVTGQSLGGGLAGLVGAMKHVDGVVFENMAFATAATKLVEARTLQSGA